MNKDTVVASALGFGLGLVAAIALWVIPRVLPQTEPKADQPVEEITREEKVTPSPTEPLIIDTPIDGQIFTDQQITLSGSSQSESLIVVSTTTNIKIANLEQGKFHTTLDLEEGANQIVVSTLHQKKLLSERLTVYYFPKGI